MKDTMDFVDNNIVPNTLKRISNWPPIFFVLF